MFRSHWTNIREHVLPDDGPVGPKHFGIINFNVLTSVKVLKRKRFQNKQTLVQIVSLIIYISRSIVRYNNENYASSSTFIIYSMICTRGCYQLYELLMMGAINVRNMQSNLAVNKYLHNTVASCWISSTQNYKTLNYKYIYIYI